MPRLAKQFIIAAVFAVTGCTTLPTGPNVMALPGTGLSFDHFRNDDAVCELYAGTQVGGGTSSPSGSEYEIQQRYDVAYVQCMYAKGHRVPLSGPFSDVVPHSNMGPSTNIPPPPPGVTPPVFQK
jgi:hypothetical protein